MTLVDPQFQDHYRTWIAFTRLLRYGLGAIVVLLVGMAYFLL